MLRTSHIDHHRHRDDTRLPQDPSPEEIRRECRRIQAEWSSNRRRRRTARPVPPWSVPVVKNGSPET